VTICNTFLQFVSSFLRLQLPLHLLFCNAGQMLSPFRYANALFLHQQTAINCNKLQQICNKLQQNVTSCAGTTRSHPTGMSSSSRPIISGTSTWSTGCSAPWRHAAQVSARAFVVMFSSQRAPTLAPEPPPSQSRHHLTVNPRIHTQTRIPFQPHTPIPNHPFSIRPLPHHQHRVARALGRCHLPATRCAGVLAPLAIQP